MLCLFGAVLSVGLVGVDSLAPSHGTPVRPTVRRHVTEEPRRNMYKQLNLDLISEPLDYNIKDKWWLTLRTPVSDVAISVLESGKIMANRERPVEDYPYDPPGGTPSSTWGLYFSVADPIVTIASPHHHQFIHNEGDSSPNPEHFGYKMTTTKYTWSLFYDGPPTTSHRTTETTTTVPTTPFPIGITYTTPSFIEKQIKDMLIYSNGYFSTCLTSLMNIVTDKEDAPLRVLCLSLSREYDKLIKEDWFASLGTSFLKLIHDFTVNVQQVPLDYTKHQAMLLSEAFRYRKEVMSKSLSGIIDYIDVLFEKTEGIALFNALELVENYPNTKEDPHQVIASLSAALFAPYKRLRNTYQTQMLIESINKEIESGIPKDRRYAYHNGIYYMHRRLGGNRTRFAIVNRDNNKVVEEDDNSTYAAEDNIRGLTRSSKLMEKKQKRTKEVGAPTRITVDSIRVHTKPVYGIEHVNPVRYGRYKMVTRRIPSFATSKLNNRLHTRTSTSSLQHFKRKHPKMYDKYIKLKRVVKDLTKGIRTASIEIKEKAFASKDIGRTMKHYQNKFLIKSIPKKTVDSNQLDKDRVSDRESQGTELVQDSNKDIKTPFYEINKNAYTTKNHARTWGYTQNKFIIKKRLKKTIESDPPGNDRESERENQGAELVKDTNKGIQTPSSEINENKYTSKNIAKTRGYNQNKFIIKKILKKTSENDPPGIYRNSELENQDAEIVQDLNKGTETPIYEIIENSYTSKNIARTKGYTQNKYIIKKKRLKKTIESDPPGNDRDSERENQRAELVKDTNKGIQTPFSEKNENKYTSKNIAKTRSYNQNKFIIKKKPKKTTENDPPGIDRNSELENQDAELVQDSNKGVETPIYEIIENAYTSQNIARTKGYTQNKYIIKKKRLKKTIESDPPGNDRESERENQGAELVKDTNKGIQTPSSEINENTYTSKNIAKTRGYNQNKFIMKKIPKKTIDSDPPGKNRESELENQETELLQESNKEISFQNFYQTPFYEINENAYTSKNIGSTQKQIQKRFIIKRRPKITIESDPPNTERDSKDELQNTKLVQLSTKDIRTPSTEIDEDGRTRNNTQKRFIIKKRPKNTSDSNKYTVFKEYALNPKFSTECEASASFSVEVSSIMPIGSFYAFTTKPKSSFKRTSKTSKFTHAHMSPANSPDDNKQIDLNINSQNRQKEDKPKNLNDETDFKPYKRRIKQTHNSTSAKISLNKINAYSSYSDEEESLKFHLFDALRHDHKYFKNARRLNQYHESKHTTKKGINEQSSYSSEETALKANIYREIGFNDEYKKTKLSDIVKRVNDKYEANIKGVTINVSMAQGLL